MGEITCTQRVYLGGDWHTNVDDQRAINVSRVDAGRFETEKGKTSLLYFRRISSIHSIAWPLSPGPTSGKMPSRTKKRFVH